MREIKFRAWNKPTKQMLYWGFFTDIFDKGAADRRNFEAEHNELMQFTGLKDKNGKEVYEGDVVVVQITMMGTDRPKEVKWESENARFVIVGYKESSWSMAGGHKTIEVIGNVYENPELLPPQGK